MCSIAQDGVDAAPKKNCRSATRPFYTNLNKLVTGSTELPELRGEDMRRQISLAMLALLLAVGGWAQSDGTKPSSNADKSPTQARPSSATNSTYVIGPEDTLHVSVWKENDLTATLPVR